MNRIDYSETGSSLSSFVIVFSCGVPCRLLEELLQKEKEYQQVLKATLQQRTHDLELVKARHRPPGKHKENT